MAPPDAALQELDQALAERSAILDEICSYLFRTGKTPPEGLLRRIAVHQAIAANSALVSDPGAAEADIGRLLEKFAPNVEVVGGSRALRCPISQSAIVDEWRGRCGHSFERSVVLGCLSQMRACPVLGCGKTLEEDRRAGR
jgi:hypothetical protein